MIGKSITKFLATASLVLTACGDDGAGVASEGSSETSSAPEVCHLGHERCGCMDGACLEGLVCLSDLCVAPDIAPGTSEGADSETTQDGTGPSSTSPDDGTSTTDASSSDGGSSDASSTDTSSSDASSSDDGSSDESTGTPEPECLDGDNYCDDAMFRTCDDGVWQYASCQENCATIGYDSPGCADHDGCHCDGFIDDYCFEAVRTLCICNPNLYQCDNPQIAEFYDLCFQDHHEVLLCYAMYPYQSPATCTAANAAC